ncbi:MAG: hypothetical protein HZC42_13940 [Candidatus Eisenbacteria bacterium]|nr:hypothetical protein [Candidatus Eisenbacteria bacterium]
MPVLLMVLALSPALAAPARAAGQSLSLTTGLSTTYDDNILQYSDTLLTVFDSGSKPTHFSIASKGDLVLNPSLALTWESDAGHGRRHALRLRGEGDFHDRNATADYRSVSVLWRESWARGRRLSLGWFTLPRYYLRQLFDEDLPLVPGQTRYRRATFRLQIGTVSWDQRLTKNTDIGVGYRYEGRAYDDAFVERDANLHQGELALGFNRLPARGSVDLEGGYRVSRAKAADADEVPGVTPDDQDLSYSGFVAGVRGRAELTRGKAWRLTGDVGYQLATRHFDSDRPADANHFGRSDLLNAVEVGLRAHYRPHFSARGFFRHEDNAATMGPNARPTFDPGSYRVSQVGLSLEWSGEVWSRGAGGGDQE